MASRSDDPKPSPKGRKVRVPFKQNREQRRRVSDWTQKARDSDNYDLDTDRTENVVAKGRLSRQRTIIVREDELRPEEMRGGTVVAMRGLYADVFDGKEIIPCTVRRILRTRLIGGRHPVAIGDHVRFRIEVRKTGAPPEGVIEEVEPRKGELRRVSGKRVHTIVANVDQAIIVTSAREPTPKPHLIDRYIVAAHHGDITPVICMNKIDLAEDELPRSILARYTRLGYTTLATSIVTGDGIAELRALLKDKESVVAGQSGVGKSSLLNDVQPGLDLKTAAVMVQKEKGRHTTTTATLIRLEQGGFVVDTPGIRAFDLSVVPRNEFEAYFIDFAPFVPHCKFPDCTHSHESECAVKDAVVRGDIDPERYESYLHMYEDPGAPV